MGANSRGHRKNAHTHTETDEEFARVDDEEEITKSRPSMIEGKE